MVADDTLISWKDGLLVSPTGARMRQVPTKHVWTSTLHCSEDGELWRRHYDVLTGTWRWDDQPTQLAMEDATGCMGLRVDCVFRPLATLIALAWHHRAPETQARVEVAEGEPLDVSSVRWKESESNQEEFEGVMPGETFKPLRWSCGIVSVPPGYEISNKGRLRKGDRITSGFFFHGTCGPTRLAAVRDCGLVDLHLAAKLMPPALELKPCLMKAFDAMMCNLTPSQFANQTGVQLDTAWNYFRQVAVYVPKSKLKLLGEALTARDLWRLLWHMRERDDPELTDKLTILMERAKGELDDNGPFARRDWAYGELGFARMCVVAQG